MKPRDVKTVVCQQCGVGFQAKSSGAKYCPKCRHEIDLTRKREYYYLHRQPAVKPRVKPDLPPKPKTLKCQGCGKEIPYRKGREFCPDCRNEKRRKRAREYAREYQKQHKKTSKKEEIKTAAPQRARKKRSLSLTECCRIAAAHGMSYGEAELAGLFR